MVVYADSPICIVCADVTLMRSKVKVTWRWPSSPFRVLYIILVFCAMQ